VGLNADEQAPIQKGKIEGNKITMEAEHHGRLIKFDLVVAADRITETPTCLLTAKARRLNWT
jgi:hypothetical protein